MEEELKAQKDRERIGYIVLAFVSLTLIFVFL